MPSIRIDGLTTSHRSLVPKKVTNRNILDALTASGKVWGFDPFQRGKVLMTILVSCYQSFKRYSLFGYYGLGLNLINGRGERSEREA